MASTVALTAFEQGTFSGGTATFTGVDIGAAAADRVLAICVTASNLSTPDPPSSFMVIDVGGVPLSIVPGTSSIDASLGVILETVIYCAQVPAGSSATITIADASGNLNGVSCYVGVYRTTGVEATASDVATSAGNPLSLSCDSESDSVGLGIGLGIGASGWTWSGATEDYDADPSGAGSQFAAASFVGSGSETPRSITATPAGAPFVQLGSFAVFPAAGGGGIDYPLTAEASSVTVSGMGVEGARGYATKANAAAYVATAQNVRLRGPEEVLDADPLALSVSGQDVRLQAERFIEAAAAAFTVTGQDVGLSKGYPAAGAAYTLTGQDVALKATRHLVANQNELTWSYLSGGASPIGNPTFTGVSFGSEAAGRILLIAAGVRTSGGEVGGVTVGGVSATKIASAVRAEALFDPAVSFWAVELPLGTSGTITITATTSSLLYAYALWRIEGASIDELTADIGSASVNNVNASVNVDVLSGGFIAAVALNEADAGATWTGLTEQFDGQGFTVAHRGFPTASATDHAVSVAIDGTLDNKVLLAIGVKPRSLTRVRGQDVGYTHIYRLRANEAAYTLAAQDVDLRKVITMPADPATYIVTGGDTQSGAGLRVDAEAATYQALGQSVGLQATRYVTADASAFVWTGNQVGLGRGLVRINEASSFIATGQAVSLSRQMYMDADAASYTVTGEDVASGQRMSAEPAHYAVEGKETFSAIIRRRIKGFIASITSAGIKGVMSGKVGMTGRTSGGKGFRAR